MSFGTSREAQKASPGVVPEFLFSRSSCSTEKLRIVFGGGDGPGRPAQRSHRPSVQTSER